LRKGALIILQVLLISVAGPLRRLTSWRSKRFKIKDLILKFQKLSGDFTTFFTLLRIKGEHA
jgi:hypothetical protein